MNKMNTLIESVYRLFRHSLTCYTYQEPKNIFEKIMNAAGKKEEVIPFYLGKERFGDEYRACRGYEKVPALETIKWDEILKEIPLCHTMTNPYGNDVIVPVPFVDDFETANSYIDYAMEEHHKDYTCTGIIFGRRAVLDSAPTTFAYYNVISQDLGMQHNEYFPKYLHYKLEHFKYDCSDISDYVEYHLQQDAPLIANFEWSGYMLYHNYPLAFHFQKTDIKMGDVDEFNRKRHHTLFSDDDMIQAKKIAYEEYPEEQIRHRYSIRELGVSNYKTQLQIIKDALSSDNPEEYWYERMKGFICPPIYGISPRIVLK